MPPRPHLPCAHGTGRSRGAWPRRSRIRRGVSPRRRPPLGTALEDHLFELGRRGRSVGPCVLGRWLMGSRALGGRVAPPARAVQCASRRSILIGRGHPCGCAIKCDHQTISHTRALFFQCSHRVAKQPMDVTVEKKTPATCPCDREHIKTMCPRFYLRKRQLDFFVRYDPEGLATSTTNRRVRKT